MLVEIIINILSILTILAQIFFVFIILAYFVSKSWLEIVKKYRLFLSFIISLTATAGSLFLSEIAHFTPCKLCWYQRIFMYPLPILILMAFKKNNKNYIYDNLLVFSLIGAFIAGFHYYLQINPTEILSCSSVGYSVSCSESFFMRYGYITIPMMSLTAFLNILILSCKKIFQ
ncbi:MAG: SPBc2 prophage-derived disulfide bond formation protein B [Patescibacteria group bacterium]|nr:MAG: SPBc2 prophage-derived disulfide bond formation protein B [Patescibacteria group bacterium]